MPQSAPQTERRALQIAVAIACLVPLSAGLAGALAGIRFLGTGNINIDSHFRYLSGLLLAIGIAFAAAIPRIETHTSRFRLLTFIVVCGGLARLLGALLHGLPSPVMTAAFVMELAVTPGLCLWQNAYARRTATR